jgi:uncharacterized protein YjbI with pentapeptide repeats
VVCNSTQPRSSFKDARVRDRRRVSWFSVDNEVLDNFGPRIGLHGFAVYCALARHAYAGDEEANVMQFLYEAHLIDREGSDRDTAANRKDPVVNLSEANLSNSYFPSTDLSHADLSGVNLFSTDHAPILTGANLSEAQLAHSQLEAASLDGANLSGAMLANSNMQGAHLSDADLSYAIVSAAALSNAYLKGADLRNAVFRDTNLEDANLTGANLSGAHKYTKVKGTTDMRMQLITNTELERQAASLQGATMPDGSKHP